MADFTNNQIKNTYQRVLQHDLSGVVQNGTGSANLGDVHISGSLYHTGSATISNNLRVLGNVTAQQFIATTVSSSVVYESGSSQFGNSLDDTHHFTGSTSTTGSTTLIGTHTHTGNSTLNGTATFSGSFIQTGSISINATGDVNLRGDFLHTGDVARNGDTKITGSLLHSGSGVTEGTYEVKEGVYGAFFANPQTIQENVTIPASYNSRIFGPITVAAGNTLIVGANAKLEIIDI